MTNTANYKSDEKLLENIENADLNAIELDEKELLKLWDESAPNALTTEHYINTNWKMIILGNTNKDPSEETKKIVKENVEQLKKAFETLESDIENLNKLTKVFQQRFTPESIAGLPQNFQDDYRNFNYTTLNKFRRPIRTSSNFFLQEILDPKENSDVIEFYKFLNKAYKSFIENNIFEQDIIEKMDIGVITLNPGVKGQSKKEITLLCEFIEGEVNNKNMLDMYCPVYDDILGNKLPRLIDSFNSKKKNAFWSVDYTEPMFSIIDNKSIPVPSKQLNSIDLQEKKENMKQELPPNMDVGIKNKLIAPAAISKFQNIWNNTEYKNKIQEKLNDIIKLKPTFTIVLNNLHNFIQKKDITFIPLIDEFAKKSSKNKELLFKINSKIGEYNTSISNRELLIQQKQYVSETEKQQHNTEVAISKLLIQVLEIMIEIEKKKPETTLVGGRKTVKNKCLPNKHNKTVKNRSY